MQDVDFASVGEFLDFLSTDELEIVEELRELVFECIPNVEEKLSFNVPFYRRNYSICFIWPGSITWDGSGHEGVRFGFNYGNLLNDESNYLDKGKRKQVYWKDFFSRKEIDTDLLRSYLYEAGLLDEQRAKLKNRRRQ